MKWDARMINSAESRHFTSKTPILPFALFYGKVIDLSCRLPHGWGERADGIARCDDLTGLGQADHTLHNLDGITQNVVVLLQHRSKVKADAHRQLDTGHGRQVIDALFHLT